MYNLEVHDANEALQRGLEYLLWEGVEEDSRNGRVLVAPTPVCTTYWQPRQRVIYSSTRDANPFFHLMETLWMLAGDNDIEFPTFFASNYGQYSDDGKTMWDAYGWRWRRFFGWDQLAAIISELRTNPTSRRCVLSMWNPMGIPEYWASDETPYSSYNDDFCVATHDGKAVPCNTHAYFDCRSGKLNMTVCNRSNDALFGCYGANLVHMSFLLEYVAMRVGKPVGVYRQFSNNLHAYLDVFSREKLERISRECDTLGCLPATGPALELGFDDDLGLFMPWARAAMRSTPQQNTVLNIPALKTPFMQAVVVPMFLAWTYRRWKDPYNTGACLNGIDAPDWRRACCEWTERRDTKKKEAGK